MITDGGIGSEMQVIALRPPIPSIFAILPGFIPDSGRCQLM